MNRATSRSSPCAPRTASAWRAALAIFAMAAVLDVEAAGLDTARLQAACTAAATATPPPRASALAEMALGEWTKFGQGKIKETSDDALVMDSAEAPLLSWDKVYQYWIATRNESVLRFAYGINTDPTGKATGIARASFVEEADAVRKAFSADPERQRRIVSALRRSGIGSVPWSAVFISTVFKLANYAPTEFEGAASHSLYMRSALRAYADARDGYGQLPCDPAWVKPRVGDLVCFSRTAAMKSWGEVLARFEAWRQRPAGSADSFPFEGHCDVVVHVSPNQTTIDTVGGNLSDTVKKSERPTKGGLLVAPAIEAPRGTGWLMVLVLAR
jgi:hypothetical protein